jgi:lysophospholipase L1-like esterase
MASHYFIHFVNILKALALLTLGSSIFANFLIFGQAKKYYLELNQTRLDPMGLRDYPKNAQALHPAGHSLVFFGDSRAASWPAPQVTDNAFINRGIASQTSLQVRERFAAHVRSLKPDVVVVQVGVNDLKTIALFPERRDAIVADCKRNIRDIVAAARDVGSTVIVTTIFPVGEVPLVRRPFWSETIAGAILEVNTDIKGLADKRTLVFDAFALLVDDRGLMARQYSADELHINGQGYAVLNQSLVRILSNIQPNKLR